MDSWGWGSVLSTIHFSLYSAYNLILLLSAAVIEEQKVQLEINFYNNNNKMAEVTPG